MRGVPTLHQTTDTSAFPKNGTSLTDLHHHQGADQECMFEIRSHPKLLLEKEKMVMEIYPAPSA